MGLGWPENSLYYVERNGKFQWSMEASPGKHERMSLHVTKTFDDIKLYYANICDYIRVLMGMMAVVVMFTADSWKLVIAFLIMGSVLLDWVDGPLARRYNQSTLMGCGWDWLADILAQYAISIWTVCSAPQRTTAFVLFQVLFSGVEIATGLFDFATSCKGFYPSEEDTTSLPWFMIVEHWLTPHHSYNKLGTACWLINTSWPLSVMLGLPAWLCNLQIPFALLYAWHEMCQLAFVVTSWADVSAAPPGGIDFMRRCRPDEVVLLKNVLGETEKLRNSKVEPSMGPIYWHNFYHENRFMIDFPSKDELHLLVSDLIREFHPKKRYINSYGIINTLAKSPHCQNWHYDYTLQTTTMFIPLVPTTHRNATQFVRGRGPSVMPENVPENDSQAWPDPHIVRDEILGVDSLEISQVIAKEFCILKLLPQTVYRGMHNLEDYDRLVFFISTSTEPPDFKKQPVPF